jgi:predicted anti-sigma-YlaC factor YlaD
VLFRSKNASILISVALDEDLNERDSAALQAHLQDCAECRRERNSLKALRGSLGVWSTEEPAESLADAFSARLRAERESREARRRVFAFPRIPAWSFAPIAVAALVMAVYFANVLPNSGARHTEVAVNRPNIKERQPAPVKIFAIPKVKTASTEKVAVMPGTRVRMASANIGRRSWVTKPSVMRNVRPIYERPAREINVSVSMASALVASARATPEAELAERVAKMKTMMASAMLNTERAIMIPASVSSENDDTPSADAAGSI